MIKLIIFDLDGVLYDSKEFHFESLNKAINQFDSKYLITKKEHLNTYDGLPTNKKLELLSSTKALPKDLHKKIWEAKQEYTLDMLNSILEDAELIEILEELKNNNIKIACCSNSIRKTVEKILQNLGIYNYFDFIQANEDVKFPKPYPEMYWNTMLEFGHLPTETAIIEDSAVGRLAALQSGSRTFFVESRKDINLDFIQDIINTKEGNNKMDTYVNKKLNVLVPLAGAGSRFSEKGYVFPKPLVEIKGKPMIEVVVNNLNIDANFIFIVQKEHVEKYNIDKMLKLIKNNSEIVVIDGITEGAACTTLLAKEYINSENPLLISNSDQFINWNPREMMYSFTSKDFDGGILTFKASHPKWSYAKVDDENIVTEVAEKNPISDNATVGVYYWRHGSDYVKFAEQMIEQNNRVNNEFYVCPVYNEAIADNKRITIGEVDKMWGIGTPEDLDNFLAENIETVF
ncbi:HAD-IA family hydrolase [Candidatus Actinomarina]|nr:HAD-IA family hydrolase [Candidatus Actinomarina sp.]|tara:strand:- start:86 stop:1462 length:1377 start_codon:yes stop_codon:yes gene_type:complete